MASGYLALTSRYCRIRAVGAATTGGAADGGAAGSSGRAGKPARPRYFFGAAAFFLAGFALAAAAALLRPAARFLARRAFHFPCRTRRRIFIDRRLSRLPMRSQYWFGDGVSS